MSRVWARALDIFHNPDIHQFALCQPAPGKRRCVDDSRNGANHDEIREAGTHIFPLFKRRTIRKRAHVLGMRKSCLFGIVCHDGRGMRTTMACEVDNDVNLPY